MKKTFLFVLSVSVAIGITYYTKKNRDIASVESAGSWQTFVKKNGREIASYPTTNKELDDAKIASEKSIQASRKPGSIHDPFKGFLVRDKRVLMGDTDAKYEDEGTELSMVNKVNPDWKEIMGNELMRFQPETTKLIIKEEIPVISINEGKGRYLEQVIVTYLSKNGDRNSFKALVDSETGSVVETWDRTIHENLMKRKKLIPFPSGDNGITSH